MLDSRLKREKKNWKNKKSSIVEDNSIYTKNLELNKFFITGNQISNGERLASLNKAMKANKDTLKKESLTLWNEKVGKLVIQGDFINLIAKEKENVT